MGEQWHLPIIGRDTWGALPPKWITPFDQSHITDLVIHWMGCRLPANLGRGRSYADLVRSVQRTHQAKRRVADIQYTAALGPDGIYQLRWTDNQNAANRPINGRSVSLLVLVGTETKGHLPDWVDGSLQSAVWQMVQQWPTIRRVTRHGRWAPTSCPGPDLSRRVKDRLSLHAPRAFTVTKEIVDAARAAEQSGEAPNRVTVATPASKYVEWDDSASSSSSPSGETASTDPPFEPAHDAPGGWLRNNPCNIRYSDSKTWLTEFLWTPPSDHGFCVFSSPRVGMRATCAHLRHNYFDKGYHTLSEIINRWAPASDGNNPSTYIDFVCEASGLGRLANLAEADTGTLAKFFAAQTRMEIGTKWARRNDRYTLAAWEQALNPNNA